MFALVPPTTLRFTLDPKPPEWLPEAPVRIEHHFDLPAPSEAVFAVLADHRDWPTWFDGMRRVRIDSPVAGVGARRTVWIGASAVQQRVTAWDHQHRLAFAAIGSNVPGIGALAEEWRLSATGADACRLDITVGAAPASALRRATGLVRSLIARSARGAAGIERHVATLPRTSEQRYSY